MSFEQASDAPIIEIRDMSISFHDQQVLRSLDLAIPRGQTLALIGESGCGKTVLLKALIGLVRPAQGEVYFDGRNLAELNDKELAVQRMRFGFLFQNAALFDSMTVGQNIEFPLREAAGRQQNEIDEIVSSRLAEVGLPEAVKSKKPAQLSGGMRKRVGLARALAISPEVMLYDEPTTGLDPIVSDVINELIIQTRSRYPVTSIIVTHDMRTATKVADRVVMVYPLSRLAASEPQILFDGSPTELETAEDQRVIQFVNGEAGERLMEMRENSSQKHGRHLKPESWMPDQ
ncbi:MAG: ABC transporter ATP-binding protein [Planctomycetaceae bacterium]|nr:ABC transporter ATP-binding protein [Planctomycetaceae bacterium]MBP60963.1 ABC transporter ATP-binding protein [Planctomycetaceae bacterium]